MLGNRHIIGHVGPDQIFGEILRMRRSSHLSCVGAGLRTQRGYAVVTKQSAAPMPYLLRFPCAADSEPDAHCCRKEPTAKSENIFFELQDHPAKNRCLAFGPDDLQRRQVRHAPVHPRGDGGLLWA